MGKRYRIRVSGKARENPDPMMLAQIVILIGRRLHAEHLRQQTAQAKGSIAEAENTTQEHEHGGEPEAETGRSDDA